jgi:hypothetical protein
MIQIMIGLWIICGIISFIWNAKMWLKDFDLLTLADLLIFFMLATVGPIGLLVAFFTWATHVKIIDRRN